MSMTSFGVIGCVLLIAAAMLWLRQPPHYPSCKKSAPRRANIDEQLLTGHQRIYLGMKSSTVTLLTLPVLGVAWYLPSCR